MKIQLDTTKKTIKVQEDVKLSKLMDTLKKILPNNEWKEFTLETNTTISYWEHPIFIEKYYPRHHWYESPWYCNTNVSAKTTEYKTTLGDNTKSYALNMGVYNIEA